MSNDLSCWGNDRNGKANRGSGHIGAQSNNGSVYKSMMDAVTFSDQHVDRVAVTAEEAYMIKK